MNISNRYKLFALAIILSNSSLAVDLPSSEANSPIPQMEIGKVKHISRDKLPPELKAFMDKEVSNLQRGYEEVSDEQFVFLGDYKNRLRLHDDVSKNLTVSLNDISKTELSKYTYEGIIPEGPTRGGPWSSVTRVFRDSNGLIIRLTEWDFVADGGGIVIVDDIMTANVAGIPAYLSVKKSPSGKSMTVLEWVSDKKQFTLTVMTNVDENSSNSAKDRKWLLALGNAIASTP
jgi:hypothetical protein